MREGDERMNDRARDATTSMIWDGKTLVSNPGTDRRQTEFSSASARRAPSSDSEHSSQSMDAGSAARGDRAGQVPARSAALGVAWTLGRARGRWRRVEPPRGTVPSGGAFGGESALVPRPRGHPTSLSSCRSVPRAGEGPSPAPTLTPPRCPWWPNRTPRARFARPTRPACSRWWRLEPRSRARLPSFAARRRDSGFRR